MARGVKAITGLDMPVFEKRRFQHGVARDRVFAERFLESDAAYRREFNDVFAT